MEKTLEKDDEENSVNPVFGNGSMIPGYNIM